jgi:hypothetical protein
MTDVTVIGRDTAFSLKGSRTILANWDDSWGSMRS